MKNKRYIIITIILILIILIIGIMVFRKNEGNSNDMENVSYVDRENDNDNNISVEDVEKVEKIKNEINATGNTDIYYIDEEYDGREILQVKADVQFDVDLAGIIKNAQPEEYELNDLIARMPKNNGVWISKQSIERFSTLLKNNGIDNFSIVEEGYLQIDSSSNELARKINNMINSNKLYIINMTGISYERDYISGEITEYPFEDMDPYQIINPYQNDNKVILEITTNKAGKLDEYEILEAITNY